MQWGGPVRWREGEQGLRASLGGSSLLFHVFTLRCVCPVQYDKSAVYLANLFDPLLEALSKVSWGEGWPEKLKKSSLHDQQPEVPWAAVGRVFAEQPVHVLIQPRLQMDGACSRCHISH